MILDNDPSNDPDYLASYGFTTNLTDVLESGINLKITVPDGIHFTGLTTPDDLVNSSQYLPNTTAYAYQLTYRDGTTENGIAAAGTKIVATNRTKQVASIVLTPNYLAAGAYTTKKAFTLEGTLLSTYSDGSLVQVGDKLNFTNEISYVANPEIKQTNVKTQTVGVPTAYVYGGVQFQKSTTPGENVAGSMNVWPTGNNTHTTYEVFEPTFYYVLPAASRYIGFSSGKKEDEAKAKISESFTDDGRTVIKIDFKGTGMYINTNLSGNIQVNLGNSIDALPGSYPYELYIYSPVTKLAQTEHVTNTSYTDGNADAIKFGSGNWIISVASTLTESVFAQGNQDFSPETTGRSDDRGSDTATFYTNIVSTFQNGTASNVVSLLNLPNINDGKSGYTFQLSGPITLPSHYTTTNGASGTAINGTVLYSPSLQTVTNGQLIDTTGYLTADKVTDWSAIRSIIIQLNNFGNLSATGRIKIAGKIVGEKTDFHHLAGTTGYLQTNMEINQQLSTSETSLSVTGTSTVTARLHYVDANGEDQYIALDDLSQSLKNNNDVLKDIYPKLITDFNATDQALIPKNYVQGSESYHYITTALTPTRIGDVATYDTDGEIIQYELVHQHDTSLTAQTTDTVHYDGLPESKLPKDKTVTVDWTGDRDQVTGVTVYKPVVSDSTNLTIKTLPVPGYDPDQAEVIFTPQQLTVSEADKLPQDEKVTVTYRAQQQSFTIKYVDDDDKESQVGDVIQETGLTDTPYNWTATAPDRYELAPNYEINYQGQFKPGIPNVVIHLIHHHTLSETTSYDNVTYTGLPAELLPADQQITVHWTVDKDDVLQTVTYLPKASKITYGIKSFDGYTVSPNAAEGSFTHTTSNKAPQDETQTVQYTAQQQSFTIKYVDDDDKGSQVGDVIQEAGLTDTPYNWTATAPDNYELKPGQILSGAGTFSVNMTDVVIHLVHHHTFAFMTSYDDVTYTGLPADKLPTKQHLTVNWTVDKDDVWKSVAYIPAARTVTYKIDHFAGYTVDPNEVSGVFTHITSHQFPTDQHQTITYTAQEQLFTIQYVDDDRNQAQVGVLIKKTGNTDTAYQWIAVAPSKYILATDQPLNGSGIFSPNMPNVVIHLVHQHSLSQVTSYDKVIYQGLPAWKKPANQQLAVNWTVNQDNVSNVTTYTPTATTIAYEIKFFDGYTVDPNPTQGYFIHRELTTLPQNETQTVSYTPQKQTFTIQYVDDDNHGVQVGLLTEKSGLTDTAFHWEAVAPTNYWLATNQKTDDAGRFEARMANVVIHLVHQHTFASMTSYDQVTYTGLPASKLPTKQRFAVNWIVDWDDIANTAIYMPTTTPVTYDIEHFAGYTVEPNMMTGTFTHTISTVTPHDEMQTVTYTAQSQSFMLQYVDDDEGGKPVGQVTTETGPMDAAYVWTAIAPDNYELATNQRTSGAGFFGVDMDNVVIHLVHRHALSQLISYDTLIYQGLPQEKLPNSQKFAVNWLVDQDEVLGTATYQTPSSKVSYSIKHFAGYTVDSAATAGTFIHAMTGVAPHDETQVVTYTAQVQFFTIQYVDDDENGQQVGDLKIESGNTDTPYHWNATSPANYALTAGYPTNGAGSFTVNMPNVVIHLRHQHDRSLTAKTTDTVTYTGLPASKYQPNQQLTINWTGDRDQVTGTVVYTPTTGGQTFNTPQIDGYRADQNEITFTPGKLTQKPMDLSQTVTYMPQIQFVNIKYVDDDCNGAQVGKITKQRGWTDAPYSWTAQTPKNYELVPGQATSGQGTFATDGNFIIIHVQHVHQLTTLTTVVRVDYTGLPASEAQSQRSRLINWQMNTDLVTRTQTYIPKPTTVVITTPTIAGYTADKKTVIFKADNTTMPPVDRQITVTYTAQPARMVVQYVDETLGKSMPELDTVLIGVTDQTGQYVVVIPQGYQLGKGQHATVNYHLTVTSAMQPLIVYLDHQFKAGTMQTVRTIHYTVMGAAQLAPQATVQTAWWNTSTDLVTHELTASAQTGYTAVLVPQIKGYVASQTSVPGISVAEIEAHGLDNQQVLVTYTALPKVSVQPKTPVKSETPAQPKAPVRLGQSTQPEAPVKPVGPQQGVQLEKAQPHRVTLIKPTSIPIRSHSVTQPSITTKRDTQHSTTELPQTNEQSRGNGALLGELLLSLLALVGVDRKKWHN
ncbi:hypothetical protein D1831_08100 [Lactiplantibacillus garii]|uniref:Gram-positive cocci surface proteins LPxTG domain-containing protein n=1 Tax=Lactiplantibacillus garii TaxID=2306423 RepID=A0A3R8KED6_9LACO|nr:hypothetical protein D1831_08100 [Lactiplantibacillus garii]